MQLNKIIEFRQQIYDHALTKARDAQFELIDALLSNRTIQSFPELSLSPSCQRQWHSVYAALEQGEQDQAWLTDFFIQHLPNAAVSVFAPTKRVQILVTVDWEGLTDEWNWASVVAKTVEESDRSGRTPPG